MPTVLTDLFSSKPTVALAAEIRLHEAVSVYRPWIGTGSIGVLRQRVFRVQHGRQRGHGTSAGLNGMAVFVTSRHWRLRKPRVADARPTGTSA